MRLDHIAYRVKDRAGAVKFFCEAMGYKPQEEFEILLEDGSKAKCQSLEPPEKTDPMAPFGSTIAFDGLTQVSLHLAPEIFVSDGPPGSVIDNWVNTWGGGRGGIHHLAYQVDNVQETMDEWKARGWLFTTPAPLSCEDLTQVFTQPNPFTNIIYEFIERKGQHGFCKANVAKLMSSTASLTPPQQERRDVVP